MLKTEQREIAGVAYECTTLPARRAVDLGASLVKILGPSLGALGDGFNLDTGEPIEGKTDVLSSAVSALMSQIDKVDVSKLMLDLLQTTIRIDPEKNARQEVGKAEVFDVVFAGNFRELMGALAFALEVSLGDFFGEGGIGGLVKRASAKAEALLSRRSLPAG